MDEFDDIEELFDDDEGDEALTPAYRVTIRNRRLFLTAWVPWLARGGPTTNLLRERAEAGVAVADLTLIGDGHKELAVRFYADGGDRDAAERILLRWARTVGYRRVWLSDRMEELDPAPEELDTANVHCPVCAVDWRDSSPEFWLMVRHNGEFPKWCAICGSELPQWTVARRRSRTKRGTADRGSPESWHGARSEAKSRRGEG